MMSGFGAMSSSDLRPCGQAPLQYPSQTDNHDALLHIFAHPIYIPDIALHISAHLHPHGLCRVVWAMLGIWVFILGNGNTLDGSRGMSA